MLSTVVHARNSPHQNAAADRARVRTGSAVSARPDPAAGRRADRSQTRAKQWRPDSGQPEL